MEAIVGLIALYSIGHAMYLAFRGKPLNTYEVVICILAIISILSIVSSL